MGFEAAERRPLVFPRPTNVYIDGFNLYHGCLKGTPFKWLDLRRFSVRLLPAECGLREIHYYTARVRALPHDPGAPTRQQMYLRALGTIPSLTIHFGRFLARTTRLPLAQRRPGDPRTVEVLKMEEKGSDVNLASHLLLHAFRRECAAALVVSNDSDLLEPIRIARRELGLSIGVASPYRVPSRVLSEHADYCRTIRAAVLRASQFPRTIDDAFGTIRKPASW